MGYYKILMKARKINMNEGMENLQQLEKAEETIAKQYSVLVDVIHWLDSNKFSNTEIRSKVDVILNHSKGLYRGEE